MLTFINFPNYIQWSLMATIILLLVVILSFMLSWKNRFRLVGILGFVIVLTVGLFGLKIGLLNYNKTTTSVSLSRVYDNAGDQIVISVKPSITKIKLLETLRQAAQNYFVYGRSMGKDNKLTIRARVLLHINEKEDLPLYLGKAEEVLNFQSYDDSKINIEVYKDALKTLSEYQRNMNLS
ncbi:Ycf51 family protein [Candidatus Atelocyanobacterium thalassae]|uniref:Uncharacterized protein n=1 Tax=cyanobacterium endosymbiont of Braarudosphaera bigelowii TaxID=1285375 RepID=A0ABM7UDL2_9CHRO|nr:Ycf51 family protein [Candidatus Atelocyanobacterium thalassa]BDA40174.1 hypothetical protein CPARK_000101200 [cyanobacterium endosymbiont of Braarudosphaera bigelowii]